MRHGFFFLPVDQSDGQPLSATVIDYSVVPNRLTQVQENPKEVVSGLPVCGCIGIEDAESPRRTKRT